MATIFRVRVRLCQKGPTIDLCTRLCQKAMKVQQPSKRSSHGFEAAHLGRGALCALGSMLVVARVFANSATNGRCVRRMLKNLNFCCELQLC